MTTEVRDSLVSFLKAEMTGPGSEDEVLEISPCNQYTAGVLFPPQQRVAERDDVGIADDGGADGPSNESEHRAPDPVQTPGTPRGPLDSTGEEGDDPVLLTNQYLPSALGLTFVVAGDDPTIILHASAARYAEDHEDDYPRWKRQGINLEPQSIRLDAGPRSRVLSLIPDELSIRLSIHRHDDGSWLTRAVLLNETGAVGGSLATRCFFQASLEVTGADGATPFLEYRLARPPVGDSEVRSLDLLYRHRKTYALGHGCAADWDTKGGEATRIRTSIVPAVKVPSVTPRAGDTPYLDMSHLSEVAAAERANLGTLLRELPDQYESWIGEQAAAIKEQVPRTLRPTAAEHLDRCRNAASRIRDGIALLERDPDCRKAFELANRVMLQQQHSARRPSRRIGDPWDPLPSSYESTHERHLGFWRTFQLAFILMNLRGIIENGADRDLVDLIWFPTGGGKTEAYLGLAAFAIFHRRLLDPTDAGCTVLMRYTLRLLTAQQFERAASMLCACELLRAEAPDRLGDTSITLGLWVGTSLSPNRKTEAVKSANNLESGSKEEENPFQLLRCPWCGTALDDPEHLGYRITSYPRTVRLVCPESRCPFSSVDTPLPILVIDEDLYETPPTFLLGTVDKFAMLAWRPEASSLFGLGRSDLLPPSLIIQDELHLISGPLGSVVGAYESVIELLCTRGECRPKIVASTATIRRAKEQCKALYDRESSQFPPPGIDIADSWFAEENVHAPGRLYVGVLPTAAPSQITALVRVAATLLQGAMSVPLPDGAGEEARDPYWTLVQYFGSLRELGRASSLVDGDIPEYLKVVRRRLDLPWEELRQIRRAPELTSRRSASEIPQILSDLELTYPGEPERYAVDTILATNMISVGVDISRLGLMLVVGQPMTTSEYIQATSRVGRTSSAPGLVVTLYNASKPRDRSHYEQFRSYHQSFYRHVEPTSVTPFSLPVIDRTLHALLVITARHLGRVRKVDRIGSAGDSLSSLREHLAERVRHIAPEHENAVLDRLESLCRRWSDTPPDTWGVLGGRPLERPLMHVAGTSIDPRWEELSWATPTSMRSVDAECRVEVLPVYPADSTRN